MYVYLYECICICMGVFVFVWVYMYLYGCQGWKLWSLCFFCSKFLISWAISSAPQWIFLYSLHPQGIKDGSQYTGLANLSIWQVWDTGRDAGHQRSPMNMHVEVRGSHHVWVSCLLLSNFFFKTASLTELELTNWLKVWVIFTALASGHPSPALFSQTVTFLGHQDSPHWWQCN